MVDGHPIVELCLAYCGPKVSLQTLGATDAPLTGATGYRKSANIPEQFDNVGKVVAVTVENSIGWLVRHLAFVVVPFHSPT